jgi:hypothetical protein
LDLKYAALAAQASQTDAVRALLGEERYRQIIQIERFATFPAQKSTPITGCNGATERCYS